MDEAVYHLNQFAALQRLTLQNLNLETLPNLWHLSDTLTYLDLSNNQLLDVSPQAYLDVLVNLQTLNLKNNKLETLPNFTNVAGSLKHLYLGTNNFNGSTLGPLSVLVKLERLELSRNPIIQWPNLTLVSSEANDPHLYLNIIKPFPPIITCTFCHFSRVDMQWCDMTEYPNLQACSEHGKSRIKSLLLKGNRLGDHSNTTLIASVSLQHLNLDDNSYTMIPSDLATMLPSLHLLQMNNNNVDKVDQTELGDAITLRIKENALTEVPYDVVETSPKILLDSNKIQHIDHLAMNMALCSNPDLAELSLSNNPFENISAIPNLKAALCYHSGQTTLWLKGVTLTCDCKMMWIKKVNTDCPSKTVYLDGLPCGAASWETVGSQLGCNDHPHVLNIYDPAGRGKLTDQCESRVRLNAILDYDPSSCYEIVNTADTVELDLWPQINASVPYASVSEVIITTREMDCRSEFHVRVYQRASDTCTNQPVCVMFHSEPVPGGATRCEFLCNCQEVGRCAEENVVYVRVAHPLVGFLCEIMARIPDTTGEDGSWLATSKKTVN